MDDPGAAQPNRITQTEPNVFSSPVRSRSTWYEETVMSAERVAASSRVRFEVTGWLSLLRNSRGFAAVTAAHAPSRVNRAGPCPGRLLVRPYLPVGVDHVLLIAGTDGFFELKRSRTRDPIFD